MAVAQENESANGQATVFIAIALFIDSMGIGIIMPVMPDLVTELTGLSLSDAAKWGGYLTVSYALMQFFFAPVLGNLADAYGRRRIFLVSLLTLGIDYVVMAAAGSIWLLFIGRIVAGAAASTFSTAFAVLADISAKGSRAKNFGIVGAAFGAGFVLGPVLGGLAGEISARAPFYLAAALSFANMAYGWFVMPETLRREKRRRFKWRRANPFGALLQVRKLPRMGWIIFAFFLFELAHYVYPAIWSFFAKQAFKWGTWEIGLSLAGVGVGFAVVQGGLIRYIQPWAGDIGTALIGFGFSISGLIALGFITEGWMVFVFLPIMALGALVTPAIKALMADMVDDDVQGELQGILASASALVMIITPFVMTQLFAWFTGPNTPIYFPAAPFVLAALIMLAALVPFFVGLKQSR